MSKTQDFKNFVMILKVKSLIKLVSNSFKTFESIVGCLTLGIRERTMSQIKSWRGDLQAKLKCLGSMHGMVLSH